MSIYQPKSIDLNGAGMAVKWDDGTTHNLSARLLRAACNCAHCVSEITGERLVDESKIPADIKLMAGQPSGNYAVVLTFSDGHNTGIFAYEYLYQLVRQADTN